MLRLGSLLALVVATLFLPFQYLYYDNDPHFAHRIVAHTTHAAIALVGLLVSYLPSARRWADTCALLMVIAMGGNLLAYFAATSGYPPLVSNVLSLLLFGAAVICSWSPRRTAAVGSLFALGFLLVGLLTHRQDLGEERFVFSNGVLLFATIIAALCANIMEAARSGIERRERELEGLSNRLMSVQEEERRRLSRELHDGVGQELTAVVAYLRAIERHLPEEDGAVRTEVAEARGLAAKTLAEIRELSQLLRPSLLDDWGLVPSLEAQVKSFKTHRDLDVRFVANEMPRLPTEVETAVYRIVQEALTNVAKHARATSVRVSLTHETDGIHLDVSDNGIGYPRNGARPGGPGLGLVSIRERVRALGGRVTLTSDHGAQLSVVLPLP
ncbi:MAG TPA: sensor histidine kinase [Candidatus Eisenbacteria bacterium]|nr:sensor histidine kinase [Candidatus Eisenbacteria bacterium]